LNDKFNFSGTTIFNFYNLDTQDKAWNLPQIESTVMMRYYPTDRLSFGVQGFFTGERFDFQKIESSSIANVYLNKITNLEAFFDLNIDASYVINNRWSATLKLNNILGQNYQRWMHFPVQGFQISAGAFYKFDL
jgi:outer membrane cobalamin receptor